MPCSYREVETLLIKLEQSLRDATLWSSSMPCDKAMQSMVPFAFDSMPFEQWLQFIFIPKMLDIVISEKVLPKNLKLLPMAEQRFSHLDSHRKVIGLIKQIDLMFTGS